MKRMCFLSLALAAALTVGCKSDRSAANNRAGDSGAVGTSGAARDNNVSSGDRNFVKDVTIANLAEMDLARTALERGSAPDVKKFAQMMIDDHTKAGNSLRTIATEYQIETPAQVDDDHRDKADKLSKKTGMDFDRDYADMMVDGHQDFIDKLESRIDKDTLSKWKAEHVEPATGKKTEAKGEAMTVTAEKSDNPITSRLNQWAADTYPVAFAHLQAAKDLQKGTKRRSTTP
jgi:putative membrane protein